MQTVERAIETSKWDNQTVTISQADLDFFGESRDRARDALLCECEGSADENDGSEEFWGVDVDGNEWRVRLA